MKKGQQSLLLLFSLVVLLGAFRPLQAQNATDSAQIICKEFEHLTCSGPIPQTINEIVSISPQGKSFNQFLRSMILDGEVIYGTEINVYIDRIADELLKNEPILRSQLEFYVLRSATVNAYATEQGIIVINVGLLAQLSNESELAVVLAHEISHFTEHHVLQMQDYMGKLSTKNAIDYFLKHHNRSREQESEADHIGFERFYASSSYSYESVDRFYDVLLYGDLPFNEEIFSREIVETTFYGFPDNYFLPSVAPITNREDVIDTLSTHPNIARRRMSAKSFTESQNNRGRNVFIQSEEAFYNMRTLARKECINIYLSHHEYDLAFYNAHVLRKEDPNDSFYERAMVEALYGLSKHKNYGQTSDVLLPYKKVEGEMQQTSYFLSKLSRTESSVLALRFAWESAKKHPENDLYVQIAEDVMKDIFIKNKMKMSDFSDYAMDTDMSEFSNENTKSDSTLQGDKYSRISKKNQNQKVKPNSKFKTVNYMLADIHSNPDFVAMYNKIIREYEALTVSQQIAQGGHKDVSKMVVLTPQFTYYGKSKKDAGKALKQQDDLEQSLNKQIIASCKRLKIDPLTFSSADIATFDTQDYNDYSALQLWSKDYHYSRGINMIYHQLPAARQSALKKGYQKVCCVTETYSYTNFMNHIKWGFLFSGIICPYFLPASIVNLSLPRQSIGLSVNIIDLTTGNIELQEGYDISTASGKSYANALIYNSLYRYKTGK